MENIIDYGYIVYKRNKLNGDIKPITVFSSEHLTSMNSYIDNFNKEWGDTLELYSGEQIIINPQILK